MATFKKTVYIPVQIETASEITDSQAKKIANAIVDQINDGFFNTDNVYDESSEVTGDYDTLVNFKLKRSTDCSEFAAQA